MQSLKQLLLMVAVLLVSASMAFGAMTQAQIKEKLEQGLKVQEVLELALLSGATLADVYAAADTVEGTDVQAREAIKESITAAAIVIATAEPSVDSDGTETPPAVTLEMTDVVASSIAAGVSLTTVMESAGSEEAKASITEAAVTVAEDTESLNLSDVAVALIASGTAPAEVTSTLTDAGAVLSESSEASAEAIDTCGSGPSPSC